MNAEETKIAVQANYGEIAKTKHTDTKATHVATSFGYSQEELVQLPDGANLGLSCGNPTALASLQESEVVVDLGSGAGLDCFLASRKVGPKGKVIGIDMTSAMIEKARANASKGSYQNVEFRLGEIEHLPIEKDFVDCIISNCVINLVPNKQQAFNECFRILKPGGRVAISDIAFRQRLPEPLASSVRMLTGCIAGAQPVDEMKAMLQSAGFINIQIVDAKADLNVYTTNETKESSCCGPSNSCTTKEKQTSGCSVSCAVELPCDSTINLNEYALSVKVTANKPITG